MKEFKIEESLEEIKNKKKNKFKNILKEKFKRNALEYLLKKQGSKGKEITYLKLEMSEYLLPTNNQLTIEQKQKMFSVKNRMIQIKSNFQNKEKKTFCFCGKVENMEHIYNCELLDKGEQRIPYKNIFSGDVLIQIEVFKIFEKKLENWENLKCETDNFSPCDPNVIRCNQ